MALNFFMNTISFHNNWAYVMHFRDNMMYISSSLHMLCIQPGANNTKINLHKDSILVN
jgi:hypothetical protein